MLCGSGNLGMLGSPGLPSLRSWALQGLQCLALPLGCLTPYNPSPTHTGGQGLQSPAPTPGTICQHTPSHHVPQTRLRPQPRRKLGATTLSSGPMRALPSSTAQPQATRSSSLSLGIWSSAPPPPPALVRAHLAAVMPCLPLRLSSPRHGLQPGAGVHGLYWEAPPPATGCLRFPRCRWCPRAHGSPLPRFLLVPLASSMEGDEGWGLQAWADVLCDPGQIPSPLRASVFPSVQMGPGW